MKYLLDTHAWIWWNMCPQNLSQRVKTLISDSSKYDELLLSAISPWEFSKLLEKGRLGISCHTVLPRPFHSDPSAQNYS
ncbi:MAG: hypothetical protein U9N58_05660 [Thermodesulfobacteriota bacterium]|nr:hypothetical protein [Thermodesulfobacteriota bacterium]